MKFLIGLKSVDSTKNPGGVGSYYLVLRKYLSADVEYFFYSDDHSSSLIKKILFRLKDIITITKKLRNKKNAPQVFILNPSLSWSSLLRDSIFLIISSNYSIKKIIFFRGWHSNVEKKIDNNRIIKKIFQFVFVRANLFIVLSEEFKKKLLSWGLQQDMIVESTVVDNYHIEEDESTVHCQAKTNKMQLLFLARVETYKGIYELLNSYSVLKKKYSFLTLCIAGDGSELPAVKVFINKNGTDGVHFPGYVKNIEKKKIFQESDLYVFPTYGEGMPNSVLEAMAFGLPVITRPVGGITDFFEDGKMGFLTESKDPAVFAELIERLILDEELRKKMGSYNFEYAKKYFYASKVAKRLENIYQHVYEGKPIEYHWKDLVE